MSRPVGVTASAIVATLGSILALLLAALLVAFLFIETPQSQHPQFVIAGTAMFTASGIWFLVRNRLRSRGRRPPKGTK